MQQHPMTAVDTFFAAPFPPLAELEQFVLVDLRKRNPWQTLPVLEWHAELGANNHALLQRIFESRTDPTVVHEVGEAIWNRGGMQAMRANFYIYCHFAGQRLKDMGLESQPWNELHGDLAKRIERLWDGIGEWRC